jgi:uncharacterized protein YkwD/LysM repeat protein
MRQRRFIFLGTVILVLLVLFSSAIPSRALSARVPALAGSPYDLVNAVNALRASFGLAPYSISPILMTTAQAQADFMAATGSMTHSGPGGIGLTARLLAAGYPLAGDLSLGGFRAENITGGDENMPAEAAVDQWTGDALHLNTMASPNLTEIGAGVALSNGRVYYVIDAARPIAAGNPPLAATSLPGGPPIAENVSPELIVPISVSTPNAEGYVFHDVRFGQTLWQIAMTYQVQIDDIKRLNDLRDNIIYPGSSLLIKQPALLPTASPTTTVPLTSLPTSTPRSDGISSTPTLGSGARVATPNATAVMNVLIGIVALAVIGGGILTWLGRSRKKG